MALPVTLVFVVRATRDLAPASKGFRDVAPEAGLDFKMTYLPSEQGENFKINLYDHGCGLVVADYDGDGRDDIFFLNQLGSNALFRNLGGFQFANTSPEHASLGLGDRICVGGAFADFDNDGDQDAYVTSTRGGNVLFENVNGQFKDITEQAGVACVAHSQTAAFFDCDNDGDLDLFVTNTAHWTSDIYNEEYGYYEGPATLWQFVGSPANYESNVLFRNNGDGTFTDNTDDAGLRGQGWSGDVAVFDFDEDGDQDLFVTNMFGLSQLYTNDGRGHFDNLTRQSLGKTTYGAIGCKAFDYNNDGRLDLLTVDMHSDMWMNPGEEWMADPAKKYSYRFGPKPEFDPRSLEKEARREIDYSAVLFGNTLFRNDGGGRFTEVSDSAGMETFWPWGVAVRDFDNDGYEDVFIPSGMGYPFSYKPNCLMMNNQDGTFTDRAAEAGIEPPRGGRFAGSTHDRQIARSSRCAAAADFDGDGRIDLIVNNFNDSPYLFRNEFPSRHYVALRLQGARSNRDAIGTVVRLYRGERVMLRQVQSGGGYLSQSSKTLHFGLGDDPAIDRVEIRWPSGIHQVLFNLEADRLHEIVESEDESSQSQSPIH